MIIAVGSWRGSGTSVAALLLSWCAALADESGAWLIEADPSGGVVAGRLQLPTHAVGGLERVAFPQGQQSTGEAFLSVAHRPKGCDDRLRVVAAPVDPFRAYSCHQPRSSWWSTLRELPGPVVIDVGSLRAGSPVQPVLDVADQVLVVTAPEVSAAVSSSEMLASGGRVAPAVARFDDERTAGDVPRARLLVVQSPGGVGFPAAELEQQLGAQCVGSLPWDPVAVDLVQRGAGPSERRLRKSPLIAAANRITTNLLAERPSIASPE